MEAWTCTGIELHNCAQRQKHWKAPGKIICQRMQSVSKGRHKLFLHETAKDISNISMTFEGLCKTRYCKVLQSVRKQYAREVKRCGKAMKNHIQNSSRVLRGLRPLLYRETHRVQITTAKSIFRMWHKSAGFGYLCFTTCRPHCCLYIVTLLSPNNFHFKFLFYRACCQCYT